MKLIVGLGNPGKGYINSRHNIGFAVVRALSKAYKIALQKDSSVVSLSGKGRIRGKEVVLALPFTFMNLSGAAVSCLLKKYRVSPEGLLVVCDDLDLAFGRLKIKARGSSAGHRGIESVAAALKGQDFTRLRVGIGRPVKGIGPAEYVLRQFSLQEKKRLPGVVAEAADCAGVWVRQGIVESMNIFNRRSIVA